MADSFHQTWRALEKRRRAAEAEASHAAESIVEKYALSPELLDEGPAEEEGEEAWKRRNAARQAVQQVAKLYGMQKGDDFSLAVGAVDAAERSLESARRWSRARMENLESTEKELSIAISATEESIRKGKSDNQERERQGCGSRSQPTSTSSAQKAGPKKGGWSTIFKNAERFPDEVLELDEFVARRGWLGGWDERDHREFKKLLSAAGMDYSKLPEIVEENKWPPLAHMSRRDIIEHCRFDQELERLKAQRRCALSRWREKLQSEQVAQQERLEAETAERERREHEQERARQESLRREREERRRAMEEERQRRQQQREAHKPADEAEGGNRKPMQPLSLEEIERRAEERRARMRERKSQACGASESPTPSSHRSRPGSRESSPRPGRKGMHAIADEAIKAAKRRAEEKRKREVEKDTTAPPSRPSSRQFVPRDPERVLQPTAAWEARQERAEEEGASEERPGSRPQLWLNGPAPFQRRAIPAWIASS